MKSTMTKAAKLEAYDRVARERDRFMLATQDALNGDICWSHWVKDPDSDGRFRVGVARLESASSGYVLVTFRHPRQKDYTTVYDADVFNNDGLWNSAVRAGYYEARTAYRADGVAA